MFLEAISLLRSTHNNWKFTIAGDGIEREALVSQAKDLGIRDVVDFPGWVPPDQVHKLINNCLLVVVPSRWQEPFGLTALQAMQYGRPVVATRVGGLPEVIEQSKTGLIVSPQNAESLADAIERLLTDFDLLQAYGIAASQRAASKFSWVNCVKKYEALYTELNL